MANVLDLRPILSETYDIILSDTETIRMRKPTEILLLRMMEQLGTLSGGDDPDHTNKQIDALNRLLADVLSNNADGRDIPLEWVCGALPLDAKIAILQGYATFAMNLASHPN